MEGYRIGQCGFIMTQNHITQTLSDLTLGGALMASPAWVPHFDDLNAALTTVTLLLGIALAGGRLGVIVRDWIRARKRGPKDE